MKKLSLILIALSVFTISNVSFAANQDASFFKINFSSSSSVEKFNIHFDYAASANAGYGDIKSDQVPYITTLTITNSPLSFTNVVFGHHTFQLTTSCKNIDLNNLQKQADINHRDIFIDIIPDLSADIVYCYPSVR